MDLKDWASLISAAVALLSLATNVYLVRNFRPHVAKREDVRIAIRDLLNVMQSRLMSVPAFQEVWSQGFKSLANIVAVVGQARTTIETSSPAIVPKAIRRDVSDLHYALSSLYDLQDSWYRFSKGSEYMHDARGWTDLKNAERRLKDVQDTYNRTRGGMTAFLEKLSE
jgi:vacuolar-type H+-ATPase subunit I/STV1